jgi:small-conductance mechanosensitive channel
MKIGEVVPVITKEWTGSVLVGFFHTFVSMLFLLLLIQIVGAVFWFFEARLAARSAAQVPTAASVHVTSAYVLKALAYINRFSRTTILVLLIAAYVFEVFRYFRGSSRLLDAIRQTLATPARAITQAIINYLPEVGYLAVIWALGYGLLKVVNFTFRSISDGTLRFPGFQQEWAGPTYKLIRVIVVLFLVMVSFPYLPGAGSQFFQGFSVFVGALVTFGSSGAIGNIIAGITLTYTNAFRIGDLIRIGDTIGFVREKSLLVTRLVTVQNEGVTIPNGNILSGSILNYSSLAATKGLTLTVNAGIGYDVDWRTVHRLMIEGARRTTYVLQDPPPCVWQTNLGDYAVVYQLRAWTDRADLMLETHSDLRAKVLDEFNRAGVEIMTPSIFAHRDASDLAIPQEQFPDRPAPEGIAVEVKTPASGPSSPTKRS